MAWTPKNAAVARGTRPTNGMAGPPAPPGARRILEAAFAPASAVRRGVACAPLFDRDDDHLHALDAVVGVEAEPPGDADALADRLAAAEPDGVTHDAADPQRELEVLVADEALRDDVDGVAEE